MIFSGCHPIVFGTAVAHFGYASRKNSAIRDSHLYLDALRKFEELLARIGTPLSPCPKTECRLNYYYEYSTDRISGRAAFTL
jgi:hypothetical protein